MGSSAGDIKARKNPAVVSLSQNYWTDRTETLDSLEPRQQNERRRFTLLKKLRLPQKRR